MAASSPSGPNVLLSVENLKMHFPIRKGFARKIVGQVRAVDDVSFSVCCGETLGLVGESGCGKTTIGRCILRAYDPTQGAIRYQNGRGEYVDLARLQGRELASYRRELRMIFQDPYSSLNPRMTVMDIVAEPLRIHRIAKGREIEDRVAEMLRKVGLRPEYMRRYPHAFSGGQRQRIGIARALVLDPRVVVCDEPVSALDVSVQAQILNLLQDLQSELNLTYLFISHDLSVVEYLANQVAVMYVGLLAEIAPTEELFQLPKHPYTEALLSAVPKTIPKRNPKRIILKGDVADPANPPSGCYFHPRCPYAIDRCQAEAPALREIGPGRKVACHLAEKLSLRGVDTG
ncbi:MAG TPA: dipeptide ABC transporter ATP-binding protein [Anaerolineales bacterium]|nr:dipeptide ABC transporter ATP-binding protein [Anaerolineales bacterium]